MQQQQNNSRRNCWNTEDVRALKNNRRDTGMSLTSSTRLTCLISHHATGGRPSHPLQCQSEQHDFNRHNATAANKTYSDNNLTWQNVHSPHDLTNRVRNDDDLEHGTCVQFCDNVTRFQNPKLNDSTTGSSVNNDSEGRDKDLSSVNINGLDSGTGSASDDNRPASVIGEEGGRFFISSDSEFSDLIPHHDAHAVAGSNQSSHNNHGLASRRLRCQTRCTSL